MSQNQVCTRAILNDDRLISSSAWPTCATQCKQFPNLPKNIIDLMNDKEDRKDNEDEQPALSRKKVKVTHPEPRAEEL